MQFALELEGALDEERLRAAAQTLLARHPNLRAAIHHDRPGKAVQVIPRHVAVPWSDDETPFDLTKPPLLRLSLEKLGDERHLLRFVNHHILMDGWSLPLFFDELFAIYDGAEPPRARPYADYLAWLGAQDAQAALAVWRDYLSGLEEPTRIASAGAPRRWQTELPAELSGALQAFARERGVTLNTVIQGLWAILLGRLTGRDEVVFGATVAGRPA